ncbi:glycoside hydrolase N-terminal domain-containing protein [Luteolibacter sp. LG18]|uniref:glycosyl hydrolase family 95 catalytic domain-containing protein n=1 Tax=Luteolibacter sp. LG18 TaxID=2819286 RepID=UPI0030C698C8
MKPSLTATLLALSLSRLAAGDVAPVQDPAPLMPRHGTVILQPAKTWEGGLAAGNGTLGAMLYGDPEKDTLLVNHSKLWLPAGSREVLPNGGDILGEMRRIIGEKGYGEGQKFFLQKAEEGGWGGKLVWTDVFHPGFFLDLNQKPSGAVKDYARVEDFSKGETWAQWTNDDGAFARRMFVSKTDNTLVTTTTGPKGKVSLTVRMQKVNSPLIESTIEHTADWITCHNVYVKGKGGYEGAVRVVSEGGTRTSDGSSVTITGADSVTLLVRILPWRTPLPDSHAWPNDPKNPDFTGPEKPVKRGTVQIPGKAYKPEWLTALKADLASMSGDYATLFKPHTAAWSSLFNRVSIDLGGSTEERGMASGPLLDKAKDEQRLSPALLERMYDSGRYVFMCSAGPETPPNLFGIWSGTWQPAWSGDYTTDTNLQLDTEIAYSGNLAECMTGYYQLWDSYMPDLRRNAKSLYNCNGILIGSRSSNNGLALHWDKGWPGNLWTPGTSWMAHWYYDHFLYTGDREFLRRTAIPFMKDCALFWEDFLKSTEDKDGLYTFRPSYSAENGWGDNTSQDIEITQELLTNLIAGCELLGIEKEGVVRWKALLAKLPPLLVNNEGALKEWSNPKQGEQNNHRHLMHLYGAFESLQFSPDSDPKLFEAAKVALMNRVKASQEDATHGYMHTGLAAAGLGMGDLAFARIEEMAKHRSTYNNMVAAHYGGPRILCVDGNGATPEIVNRMFIQSRVGDLTLLPAVPKALPKGSLKGTRARGNITVEEIQWDLGAGTCEVTLSSAAKQEVVIALPNELGVTKMSVGDKEVAVAAQGVARSGAKVMLPKGSPVKIAVAFKK